MGMTRRNARSALGERPTSSKQIAPLKLALGALALLLVSGVLAQSGGGYALDPWVVADGGAISSGGGYSMGSTAGQTGAGTVSGGNYTLYGGFWKPGTIAPTPVPLIGRIVYVSAILKSLPPPTPTPTPPPPPTIECSDKEPNNDPEHGQPLNTVNGSCNGSFQTEPVGNFDYYAIQPNQGQHIIVKLTGIPAGANYDLSLQRKDGPTVYTPVGTSAKLGQSDELIDYVADSSNRYYIRVKLTTKSPSATNKYVLSVSIN